MARLDNSEQDVIIRFSLDYDENDPGMTNPVDICNACFLSEYQELCDCQIEHPDYSEDRYFCMVCECRLTDDDNWFEY